MAVKKDVFSQSLDCASIGVEVTSADRSVIDFVLEYFDPWFRPTTRAAEWRIDIRSAAPSYDEMRRQQPADAMPQACFAHDQQVLSLPAWRSGDTIDVVDANRACFLRLGRGRVDLIVDPSSRRWRFTLLWIVQEIAATRLRQSHVDMHAASVFDAGAGRAMAIAGPKGAGKTTLSFYLIGPRGWDWIANDRTFIGGQSPVFAVAGMPTAVRIRPPTLAQYPELRRGLPAVARPYLYTIAELENAEPSEEPVDSVDFILTPNQIAPRLRARTHAEARLGAIVFPQVCPDEATWSVEPIAANDVVAAVHDNLYGVATGERPATFFETLGGGSHGVSHALAAAIGAGVAGYRVRLGRQAYANGGLSEHLRQLLVGR